MRFLLVLLCLFVPFQCVAQRVVQPGTLPYYELHRQPLTRVTARQMRVYWEEMEKCSGIKKDVRSVTFYQYKTNKAAVPVWVDYNEQAFVVAWWEQSDNSITILSTHVHEKVVIQHEMLHALIGVPGHPQLIYSVRCRIPITY